jgi:hypothetical protein
MRVVPFARALALVLATAPAWPVGPALGDVEMIRPAPRRPAFDDSGIGLFQQDLRMERDAWLKLLRQVRGAQIQTLKQGSDASCAADIERKLKIEGYALMDINDLNIVMRETPGPTVVAQAVDALQGYVDRKFAVRLLPSLYVTVSPRPGLKKEELKRNFEEFLSGVATGYLGHVKAYLIREFDPPVKIVCVEIDLTSKANFDSVIRLFELSLGAMMNNQSKELEAEIEQTFGDQARKVFGEMEPPAKYMWGK